MIYSNESTMIYSESTKIYCMSIGKRVTEARNYAKLSKAELSRLTKISKQGIGQIENGTTKNPQPSNLKQIAKACGVNVSWLIDGESYMINNGPINEDALTYNATPRPTSNIAKIPLYDDVPADYSTGLALDKHEPVEWLHAPCEMGENAFALRVRGVSMEPDYPNDCIIYVDPSLDAIHNNDVVVLRDSTELSTFKRLQIDNGGRYLIALNKSYSPSILPLSVEAFICGVVVFMGKFTDQ